VQYPDEEQYRPFTQPESVPSSTATRVRHAVRIALGLAVVAALVWAGWEFGPRRSGSSGPVSRCRWRCGHGESGGRARTSATG